MATTDKAKKERKKTKKWYPVTCPEMFGDRHIGEVPTYEVSSLIGRKLTLNLMTITNDFKHQDTNLTVTVKSLSGNVGIASLDAFKLSLSSLKRIVRRKSDRVDYVGILNLKNSQRAVVKAVIITLSNTFSQVRTRLQKATAEYLSNEAKGLNFTEFVKGVIDNKLQKELKNKLNKIYPVRYALVREVKLLGDSAPHPEPKVESKGEEPVTAIEGESGSPDAEEKAATEQGGEYKDS